MESIGQEAGKDDSPPPEPTIPILVARVKAALSRLLRLVRPAEADKIRETVDELADAFGELLETVLRQSQSQAASAVTALLDRLDELEARIASLEGDQTRAVGGSDPHE